MQIKMILRFLSYPSSQDGQGQEHMTADSGEDKGKGHLPTAGGNTPMYGYNGNQCGSSSGSWK